MRVTLRVLALISNSFHEALRNLQHRQAVNLAIYVSTVLICALFVVTLLSSQRQDWNDAAEFVASGGLYVRVVREHGLSGDSCDWLANSAGISAAGAVSDQSGDLATRALYRHVSIGFDPFLTPVDGDEMPTGNTLAYATSRTKSNLAIDDRFRLASLDTNVVGVDPTLPVDVYGSVLLITATDDGQFTECWIEADLGAIGVVRANAAALMGVDDGTATVSFSAGDELPALFTSRQTLAQRLFMALGLVMAPILIGAISAITRRTEMGIYRLAGYSALEVAAIATFEIGAMLVLAILSGVTVAAVAIVLSDVQPLAGQARLLITVAIAGWIPAVPITIAVAFAVASGRPVDLLKPDG